MVMKLGKLEQITDLRSIWKHEANDFTPWLAKEENLAALSDAIGIELVLEEQESNVGDFSVDLFATEEGTGRKVVIENQLEETNHDHLGKIITYASGKDAEVIIWIVRKARDEHKKAIEWLNQHTDDSSAFFLIEIEVWKIGNSEPAPKFNIVERPNDWAKAMKNVSITNTQSRQMQFWQYFVDRWENNSNFAHTFRKRKAHPQNWYDLSIGSSEYHLCMEVHFQKNDINAGLYIPDNKNIYNSLLDNKKEIEDFLGATVEWRNAKKASRFLISKNLDINNPDKLDEACDWLMDMCLKIKMVTNKFSK